VTERRLVIIIGAARSGTKMLRDCLGKQEGACPVPYDINFIWRLGNDSLPHDEISASLATGTARRKIARRLDRWWSQPVLVEKTVSNALRVPYIYALFPNAKFIHLIRDGYDVVESSYRQWIAEPDWRYVVSKALSIPPVYAPRYAFRVGRAMLGRQFQASSRVPPPIWGPAYDGIHEDLTNEDTMLVVSRQWRRCVEKSLADLTTVPKDQQLEIRYEHFVHDPVGELERLADYCGIECSTLRVERKDIRTSEQGKGRSYLNRDQLAVVHAEIDSVNKMLGYY
jgi:hypothetical protein